MWGWGLVGAAEGGRAGGRAATCCFWLFCLPVFTSFSCCTVRPRSSEECVEQQLILLPGGAPDPCSNLQVWLC